MSEGDTHFEEKADIADAVEPIEKAAAKERMIAAHASPGKFPTQVKARALDKVGKAVGMDRRAMEAWATAGEDGEAGERAPAAPGGDRPRAVAVVAVTVRLDRSRPSVRSMLPVGPMQFPRQRR